MPIYINQSILTIKLNTGFDISSATSYKILYSKPDDTTGEWVGALDGTMHIVYNTLAGDLDQAGVWKVQSYVVIAGDEGYGEVANLIVASNLD